MKNELEEKFRTRYQKQAEHVFFCPGRVNLIGEHIDYNGGQVMPFAITLGSYLAVSKNNDNILRFQSLNFPEQIEFPLQNSYIKTGKEWCNYPLGVINHFILDGNPLSGLDLLFYGDLPIGAGLSSSASIEVLMAFAITVIFNIDTSRKEIALLSKKVENEFIGVNSGIMDQYAVALGKESNALLLNCDTVTHRYIPFNLGKYAAIIINSNKQRTLADSKYNERYAECMEALRLLKEVLPITNLCEINTSVFNDHTYLIENPVVRKRALHVVSENERVHIAADALESGDLEKLGGLLYASHESLKELYEVSGKELDAIADFSKSFPACLGARMTGAGFGGCAIALVEKNSAPKYAEKLIVYYTETIGYKPDVFISAISNGVCEL